jgi:hypothetical protein
MTNNPTCLICGSSKSTLIRKYSNISQIFKGLKLFACENCSLVYASPMPDDKTLFEYNASYFDSAHGGQPDNPTTIAFFKAIAKIKANYVNKYIAEQQIKINTIMEIGPGPGYFAENWIANNPSINYIAFESDTTCYNSLKSYGVKLFHELAADEQASLSVDLVVISHVLEHVSDPKGFLRFATSHLRKGGLLFIEVPCTDYLHKKMDEPHLLFFDKKPMQILLQELSFENIQLNYYGQKIKDLQHISFQKKLIKVLRNKLISVGITAPFALPVKGLKNINSSLERAVVAPFMAHEESAQPAWWLRALSVKK